MKANSATESSLRRMADRLTGGQLDKLLKEGREAGHSYATISRDLYVSYGVEASYETVRQWITDLATTQES